MCEKQYRIPDLLRDWPWERLLSPYYAEAKAESSAWIESFKPFTQTGQKAFNACDLNLLASLTYSNRNREFVRLGCDLMNFYFVYDEYTDVSNPAFAEDLAEVVIDAINNPQAHQEASHILVEMTQEFMQRAQKIAGPESPCHKHFIHVSDVYLRAVAQEAHDRVAQRVRSLEDYMDLRRNTSGARPTVALIEFGLDLPEFVTSHPAIVSLTQNAVDLIVIVNDMHSYVREISCGLAYHNIITVIMHDRNLDLQEALDWLKGYTDEIVLRFLDDIKRIPSWGADLDRRVQIYIEGLGQWVRGNDDWSCEGKRYHGDDGMRIKETRLITIQPRQRNYLLPDDGLAPPETLEIVELGSKNCFAMTELFRQDLQGWPLVASVLAAFTSTIGWASL